MTQSELANLNNSFGLKSQAKNLLEINCLNDLDQLNSVELDNALILGSGTNVILDKFIDCTVLAIKLHKISIEEDLVLADAGVAWSDFIEFCLQNNLYGIENLTHIPGSVGAAPVQNIGAYGVEISSFIESIFCFNLSSMQTETLHHDQCEFGYRDSIFKSKGYIILSVTFKLNKKFLPNLNYPSLNNFLIESAIDQKTISPRVLSDSIRMIRDQRLPNPEIIPNVGSIFKNPVVKTTDYSIDFLAGHRWEKENNFTKFSAARLIELIYKDLNVPKSLGFYENHSLVLINNGNATFDEIIHLLTEIQDMVYARFSIHLSTEPEIITS
jgi:UDP-N-acetylmuramate dehydrogenase